MTIYALSAAVALADIIAVTVTSRWLANRRFNRALIDQRVAQIGARR